MHGWTLDEADSLVKRNLKAVGKSEDDMYVVPTKHGHHIITSSFNLQATYEECDMLFEGVQNRLYANFKCCCTEKQLGFCIIYL